MAYIERIKDILSVPFTPTIIEQRTAAGWQLVAMEWKRELPGDPPQGEGIFHEDIPYGLRISNDCKRLEVDPVEDQALVLMMEMLVQDFPYSAIVSTLHERGFRMRDGRPWDRVSIFKMHPRLIEIGPRLFSSEDWKKRRLTFSKTL